MLQTCGNEDKCFSLVASALDWAVSHSQHSDISKKHWDLYQTYIFYFFIKKIRSKEALYLDLKGLKQSKSDAGGGGEGG